MPATHTPRCLTRRKKAGLCLLAALGALLFFGGPLAERHLVVNLTPSMPGRVYLKLSRPAGRGDAILYCPLGRARKVLDAIGFRMRSEQCPDGKIGLVKEVAGVPGDWVAADGVHALAINGKTVIKSGPDPLLHLPAWKFEGRVPEGKLVLLGMTSDSFDSRYFGLLEAEGAASVLKEIF